MPIALVVFIMLVSGCISAQTGPEINTSAGTLIITDVEFVNSFPPGCTLEPGCEYPLDGYTILVIWTERKDGGNIEEISNMLVEETVPFISEKPGYLYVSGSDGSVTNLARVHTQSDSSDSKFALVFAPPVSAHDFKLFWPGNEAIDIGK